MVRGFNSKSLAARENNEDAENGLTTAPVSKFGERVSTGGHVQLISVESPRTENLADDFYENHDK